MTSRHPVLPSTPASVASRRFSRLFSRLQRPTHTFTLGESDQSAMHRNAWPVAAINYERLQRTPTGCLDI